MDSPCIFLGIKVKPGPIERFKLDNYTLDNTVDHLKTEAGKKANVQSSSLELIHHGKILKSNSTLQDSGVKNGEMVHVVKKKQEEDTATPRLSCSDSDLQALNSALRSLGCTPSAAGWTRAMQLLNEESVMNEILDVVPSMAEDCVALSILHEVELLAALGANVQTMRRGVEAHPELLAALMQLLRLQRARASHSPPSDTGPAISGFAYSLEALSEEEDAEEEEAEEPERSPITQEQLAAALQAATEAVSSSSRGAGGAGTGAGAEGSRQIFMRMLNDRRRANMIARAAAIGQPGVIRPGMFSEDTSEQTAEASAGRGVISPEAFNEAISEAISRVGATLAAPSQATPASAGRGVISPEAFNEAITEAISRAGATLAAPSPPTQASSSQSTARAALGGEEFTTQLNHMHEMGLLDDASNIRALLICAGDVNAAINLVFSGAIGDD